MDATALTDSRKVKMCPHGYRYDDRHAFDCPACTKRRKK